MNDKKEIILICKCCKREFIWDKHGKNYCNSCFTNSKRFKIKQKCIEYKGGCCSKCGYNKCNDALVFHHLGETKKEFGISGNYCRSWEKIKVELDKCVLLCANCHCEIHASMKNVDFDKKSC
jgi:hypothetical protein